MKPATQFLPPRQSVIYAYTRRMLDETAKNANSFAMAVAERYCAMTAPDVRHVALKLGEGDELFEAMKANGQTLRRYMDGTVKSLPADLEDAWVQSLPEPYRSNCERDLARRRGRYSFELPADSTSEDFAAIGDVMQQAGELVTEWGKSVADGKLDAAELARIENESDDVIAALLRLRQYARERAKQGAGAA
jgi:hypothetical protein